MFPKITTSDIDNFEATYRFSDEERADVLKAYVQNQGDMTKIFESVMLSKSSDGNRFVKIVRSAIDDGRVTAFPAFETAENKYGGTKKKKSGRRGKSTTTTTAGTRKPKKKTKKKGKDTDALEELRATILNRNRNATTTALATDSKTKRQREFEAMTDVLAAKYCNPKKAGGSKKRRKSNKTRHAPPTDEEFERLQAKMFGRGAAQSP